MRRINQRPNPLPATIADHLRPLSWADSHVQAFGPLSDRHDGRLASLSGSIAGALLHAIILIASGPMMLAHGYSN